MKIRNQAVERYRFVEHTADAKFQAFGSSLEEAFGNAALALSSLMWEWEKIDTASKQKIAVLARDQFQLLLVFLEEILFLFETKNFMVGGVKDLCISRSESGYSLTGWFAGENITDKHRISGDVKAVTYNEMKIEKNDRFVVQVVVDV